MNKKIFYLDVESTGLDPQKHDIIQLAYIIEIDGEVKDRGVFHIQPFNYKTIDQSALEISHTTVKDLLMYPEPREVYKKLTSLLDKYIDKYNKQDKFSPGGFNVNFDKEFLKNFFLKNNDKYFGSYFDYHILDPVTFLYLLDYKGLLKLENYKLVTVCKHFNIPIEAHDALSDIEATRKVILKLMEYLK